MLKSQPGKCAKDDLSFYTTPYGLGATVNCAVQPLLDHSLNDDTWTMQEIVIKTPGEHSIWNNQTSEEETFVGEIQIGYKGSSGVNDTAAEGHAENIAIVGVLLKLGRESDADDEIEKLIRGWEEYQTLQYKSCNVQYNDNECTLLDNSKVSTVVSPVAAPGDAPSVAPTDVPNIAPTTSPITTSTSTPVTLPVASPYVCADCKDCCGGRNLGALVDQGHRKLAEKAKLQAEEIQKLKAQLETCNASAERNHHRVLGQFNRKCPDSYYCFMNLYKRTQTDVSYDHGSYKVSVQVYLLIYLVLR